VVETGLVDGVEPLPIVRTANSLSAGHHNVTNGGIVPLCG
jgi:hypothetical protein